MLPKRSALLLIPLLAGLAIWALAFRPVPVQLLTPERDVPVQVFGLGTVEARVISRVGFKGTGVLTELHADHGDTVARGAALARLDNREQTARVGRARAGVAQATANLNRTLANVAKAEAAHANARSIHERRQSLVQKNNVSVEATEGAKATLEITRADLNLALREVDVARATVSDAEAQVVIEEIALGLHTLTAPYAAVVVARQKELGSVLAPGEVVFTLADPQTVWVLGYIDESKAGGIQVGQPAEIVLRSLPGQRFSGRVARVEIESDRVNEERRIAVAFDAIPREFHLGEQAEVFITTARLPQALLIPAHAIHELKGQTGTVWTVEEDKLAQREVTLGPRLLDGRIEIVNGIPTGGRVLAALPSGLRVGRGARESGEGPR